MIWYKTVHEYKQIIRPYRSRRAAHRGDTNIGRRQTLIRNGASRIARARGDHYHKRRGYHRGIMAR